MATVELIRKSLDVNLANLMLGHEVFQADGATFVRNVEYANIHDANFVTRIGASSDAAIDALLLRIDVEYAHTKHRVIRTDNDTPQAFEARLALDGYTCTSALVSVLEGELIGSAKPADLRPVADESGWHAYFDLHAHDWDEHADRAGIDDAARRSVGLAMAATQRLKSPPVRHWLAYADGAARGYLNAWEGTDGVGQVENLFVLKQYRHRGLATALIHHCVIDARAHGAGPIVIVSDPTDTPKHMYAAMGFQPVAIQRQWRKELTG